MKRPKIGPDLQCIVNYYSIILVIAVVLIFSSQLWSTLKGLLAEDAIVSTTTGLVDKCTMHGKQH